MHNFTIVDFEHESHIFCVSSNLYMFCISRENSEDNKTSQMQTVRKLALMPGFQKVTLQDHIGEGASRLISVWVWLPKKKMHYVLCILLND